MKYVLIKVAVLFLLVFGQSSYAKTQIGIHFFVDRELGGENYMNAQVERIVADVNRYYSMSGIKMEIVPVKISHYHIKNDFFRALYDIAGVEKNGTIQGHGGSLYHYAVNSGEYGASYVYALVADGDSSCGRAVSVNYGGTSEGLNLGIAKVGYRTAISRFSCGSDTVAHELGHLMGLAHGNKIAECLGYSSHARGVTRAAKGWTEGNCDGIQQPNEFATLMSHNWGVNEVGARIVPVFSSPDVRHIHCGQDQNCGDNKDGNAVSVMNKYRRHYSRLLPIPFEGGE